MSRFAVTFNYRKVMKESARGQTAIMLSGALERILTPWEKLRQPSLDGDSREKCRSRERHDSNAHWPGE